MKEKILYEKGNNIIKMEKKGEEIILLKKSSVSEYWKSMSIPKKCVEKMSKFLKE
ncbi:MAG: hypothetical protein ACOCP8_05970 [archaeon]